VSSGRTRTKAEHRAAGLRRLEVLLDAETMERLETIARELGGTRADAVRAIIDQAWSERASTLESDG
jgi:delta 1-pyrroline-5-carboxylate dehydrogenase